MMPEAPALLSTMTCWRSFLDTDCARMRKPASAGPPAAHGMIRRIGRSGNFACARTGPAAANGKADAPTRAARRVKRFMLLNSLSPRTLITGPCKGQATARIPVGGIPLPGPGLALNVRGKVPRQAGHEIREA